MAKLLNRVGRTLCSLQEVEIDYPVGRAGSRFRASVATRDLSGLDTTQLRFFLLQDDAGNRYPATIEQVTTDNEGEIERTILRGVLVCRR